MAEGGGIIFVWHEPGIYEVHTNFLPHHRGAHAIKASLAAYHWMFCNTDCMTLLTKVPQFNEAARLVCELVGATEDFRRSAIWPTETGTADLSFWSLKYSDWVRQTPDLIKSGREFHRYLDEEFARHGVSEPHHPEEECHDLHVGACVEMIYAGQPEKAVILYNRWARFAGYGSIALLARNPLVLDIGDAILQVTDGTFKVIKLIQRGA